MVVVFYILVTYVIWRSLSKKKAPPLDISKNSDYYIKEFPEFFKEEPLEEPKKTPITNITVNVTNNHLHIHTKS